MNLRFFHRLAALFRRDDLDRDLESEMSAHLDLAIEENLKSGMSPSDARRQALIHFGGPQQAKEIHRDSRGIPAIEVLLQDTRFAFRMFRKSPSFTAIAILTLALGIGANTTIFSWVRSVLLNPLPGAANPERVVALETLTPDANWVPTSYLDFRDLRDNSKLLESMSVAKPVALAVGDDTAVERVWGEAVSGNFFDLLRVTPQLGRFFSTAEVDRQQNAHPLAIISHSYWASHFQSDPRVIGATLRINHLPYTVIGVAPATFHGSMPGFSFEMWLPATMYGQLTATGDHTLVDRKWRTFRVLARLAPGVSLEQARAQVQSLASEMARRDADTNEGMSATLLPLWKSHYGIQDSLRAPLTILMAACGVLLLIVCANLANLLLARITSRQKEFSVRLALGAPRSRLVRQLLTESFLIAVAGSLAGLAFAVPLRGLLSYLLPQAASPALTDAPLDLGVLLFTIALTFLVAFLAGIAPALHAAKGDVNDTLKESGRSGASVHSLRLLGFFVTSEMALAVVALIAAGLFLKSFRHSSEIRPGFDPGHVAIAQLNLGAASFDARQADSFCLRLQEQLQRQPGVTAVSYADYVPLSVSSGSWEDLQIQGYVPARGENMKLYRTLAAPGYFDLLKIPILQGRDFTSRDDSEAPPVMIVNQEFLRRYIPTGIALGRRVQGWGQWFTIVGVVSDSKIYRLTEPPTPYFYVPIRQIYRPEMGLVFFVRTSASVQSAISALRRETQAVGPAVPLFDASSLDDSIAASLFTQRISASLLTILGSVALLLAAIGLYGVIGYSVAQRTREIGIRMALGATPGIVQRSVLARTLRLALIGIAVGTVASFAVSRVIASFLFKTESHDPATFAAVISLLVAVALLAGYFPSLRATRIDPVSALRSE